MIRIDDPYGYVKPLIKERYNKSETEKDIFNQFICLWISFNAFYSNCNNKDTEDDQITFIADYFKSFDDIIESKEIKDFYDFINSRKLYFFAKFNKGLLNLGCYKKNIEKINLSDDDEKSLLTKGDFEKATKFNGLILKGKTASRNVLVRYYDDIKNLRAFLFVLYQIRCNLFHGGKNPGSEDVKDVIAKAVPSLKKFLEILYEKTDKFDFPNPPSTPLKKIDKKE